MAVNTQTVWNDKHKATVSVPDAANWTKVAAVVEKMLVPLIQTEPLKRRRHKIDPAALVTYNPLAAQLTKGVAPSVDNKKNCNQTVAMVLIADKLIQTHDAKPDFIISHAQWAADNWNCYRVPRHRTSFLHLHLRCPNILAEPFNLHFHLSSTSGVSGRRRDSSGKSLVVNVMGMRGANGLQTYLVIQPPRHKARGKVYCTQDGYCRLDILRSDTAYFECFLFNPPDAPWAMTLDYCGRDPVSYPADGRQLFPRLPQAIRNQFPWIDWAACPEPRAQKKSSAAASKSTSSNESGSSSEDDDDDEKKPAKKKVKPTPNGKTAANGKAAADEKTPDSKASGGKAPKGKKTPNGKDAAKGKAAANGKKGAGAKATQSKSPAAKKTKLTPVKPPTRPGSSGLVPKPPPSPSFGASALKAVAAAAAAATKLAVKKEPNGVKQEPTSDDDEDNDDGDDEDDEDADSDYSADVHATTLSSYGGATITLARPSKRHISEITTAPIPFSMALRSQAANVVSVLSSAPPQPIGNPSSLSGFSLLPSLPATTVPFALPSTMSPPPFEPPRTDLCTGNCQHRLLVLSGPIWLSHSSLQIRLRCCGCKTPVDSSGSPTDLPAKHAVALLSEVSLDYHESVPCTVESPGVLLLTMEYASIMFRPTILDDDQKRCWKIQVTHLHPTTLTPIPAIVPHYAYVPVADTNTRPVVERGASGSGVPRTTSGTSTQDLCRITSLPTNNPGPPPLFPYVLESLPSIGRAFPPHGSFTLPRIGTLPPMTAGVPSSQSFSSVLGLPDSYLPRETSSVVRLTTLGREESFNRLTRESSGSSVPRESSLPQTVNSDSTSTTSSSSVHRESTVPRDSTDYGFSFERRLGGSSLRPALPLPSSLSTSSLLPAPPSLSSTLAAIAPSSAPPRVPV